ncbi:MAG: serine protease, partial [Halobacteriovoraceae bacterium]|nr:serine protease [Halobacteriovoraceae bacterium]
MKLSPIFLALFFSLKSFGSVCQLPKDVAQKVSQSIFQIIPINSYAAHMDVERARELHKESCLQSSPLLHQRLNCEVLRTCKSEETCVREYGAHGTAFLAGGKLATAWHVVFPTHSTALLFLQNHLSNLSREELKEKLAVLKPQFVLFNTKGDKVFDTREHKENEATYLTWGDPLSTIYSSNGVKKKVPYGHYENIPEDYVFIDLPKTIGPDLPFAKRKSDCSYSAGFGFNGEKTEYQINGGLKTSIVNRQKHLTHLIPFQYTPQEITPEEFQKLSEEEALRLMDFDEDSIHNQIERYGREKVRQSINVVYRSHLRHMRDQEMDDHSKVHVHDGEVYPGQSGGPLLNESGEVFGITT